MKKKIIFLILVFISIGCSSYKFTGNPIQINSQKLNNKVSFISNKVKIDFNEQKWKTELLTLLQNLSKSNE